PSTTARPTSPKNFDSFAKLAPDCSAILSTTQKPALWRVRSYSRPTLPRPTTRRIPFIAASLPSKVGTPARPGPGGRLGTGQAGGHARPADGQLAGVSPSAPPSPAPASSSAAAPPLTVATTMVGLSPPCA